MRSIGSLQSPFISSTSMSSDTACFPNRGVQRGDTDSATSPYLAFPAKVDRDGDEVDHLRELVRAREHGNAEGPHTVDRLRCSCAECERWKFVGKFRRNTSPTYRRVHWLHCKEFAEIRQFHETPVGLDVTMRTKIRTIHENSTSGINT